MTISANDVKNLRERTGAGMMDCKKALAEVNGDFDKAVENLKKHGLAKALKKGDRIAAEGLIFTKIAGSEAIMLELNCETDFVAKNDDFLNLGQKLVDVILAKKPASVEEAMNLSLDKETVNEKINSLIAVIGEKISLRRFEILSASNGKVVLYNHQGGKIAVLIAVSGEKVTDDVARDLAMQVAAMAPRYVDKSEVGPDVLAAEKKIFLEQLKSSGKPAEILEKIVMGKLDRFASEMSLMQQVFVKDPAGKKTIAQYLKEADPQAKVLKFARFAVGEGIEKKKEDFAEEVAKMM